MKSLNPLGIGEGFEPYEFKQAKKQAIKQANVLKTERKNKRLNHTHQFN